MADEASTLKKRTAKRLSTLRDLQERQAAAALLASRKEIERTQMQLDQARQHVASAEDALSRDVHAFYGVIMSREVSAETFDAGHAGMERLAAMIVDAKRNAERAAQTDALARSAHDEKTAVHRKAFRKKRGSHELVDRFTAEILRAEDQASEAANEELCDSRPKQAERGSTRVSPTSRTPSSEASSWRP